MKKQTNNDVPPVPLSRFVRPFRVRCIRPKVWRLRSPYLPEGEKMIYGYHEKSVRHIASVMRENISRFVAEGSWQYGPNACEHTTPRNEA